MFECYDWESFIYRLGLRYQHETRGYKAGGQLTIKCKWLIQAFRCKLWLKMGTYITKTTTNGFKRGSRNQKIWRGTLMMMEHCVAHIEDVLVKVLLRYYDVTWKDHTIIQTSVW